MRAAYTALILGVLGGLWLATNALTAGGDAAPVTVAAALTSGADAADIDARRAEAVAVLVARCMRAHGLTWVPWIGPSPRPP